jgi:hypothetical protein
LKADHFCGASAAIAALQSQSSPALFTGIVADIHNELAALQEKRDRMKRRADRKLSKAKSALNKLQVFLFVDVSVSYLSRATFESHFVQKL